MPSEPRAEHVRWVEAALERYERPLVSYATRLLGDSEAARDAVQETFLRLCRAERDEIDGRLAPWLYTVCRRVAIDVRRKGRRSHPIDGAVLDERAGAAAEPASEFAERDATREAIDAVYRLPARQQEAILLKFRHGLAYRDIAEVTGLTPTHVGVLIHEGMKTLRARLGATPISRAPARMEGAR